LGKTQDAGVDFRSRAVFSSSVQRSVSDAGFLLARKARKDVVRMWNDVKDGRKWYKCKDCKDTFLYLDKDGRCVDCADKVR